MSINYRLSLRLTQELFSQRTFTAGWATVVAKRDLAAKAVLVRERSMANVVRLDVRNVNRGMWARNANVK